MRGGRSAALLASCWASLALAAGQSDADLYGRVLDPSEAGIGQASILVVNEDTGFRRFTESEFGGTYAVASLQPGIYKVTVRKEGFRTLIRFGVRLMAAAPTRVDFCLPVGSIEESITVSGAAPILNQDDASTGGRFDHENLGSLPLNGGGMLNLLELVPGTNITPATRGEAGQFSATGQRPNTNYFTVDGVSANIGVTAGGLPAQSPAGSLPALSSFGSADSLISLDAVADFRVQTSSTVAAFGRLPGASVGLSSRSGSNEVHGSTSYQVRNELLSANDWFSNASGYGRAPLRLQDFTQTLGGPIHRNRTFFFLSFQRIALSQPYVWRQPVPSLAVRQSASTWAQPVLNLFPAPNRGLLSDGIGEWVGRSDRPASLDAGGARIDEALTSRVMLFGRYNDSPSANQFGTVQVNRLDLRIQSLTLGLNLRPNADTVLESRVNESQASAHSLWTDPHSQTPGCELEPLTTDFLGAPATCDYLVRFSIGGIGQLVSGREGDRRQRQFQAVQSVSLRRGKHSLGFGVDYRRITAVRRDPTGSLGVIADTLSLVSDKNSLWIARSEAQNASTEVNELSLWVQDTWQGTPRLTSAPGLRWEFSPAPSESQKVYVLDDAADTVHPLVGVPLWPLSFRNFAPRLGAVYRLTADGRTVLRAGGGLYYDSSMSIATDILNGGPMSISSFSSARGGLFSAQLTYGFMRSLQLPEVGQWSVSLERAFGSRDVVSLGYVGAAGWNLIRREVGGAGSTELSPLVLTTNHGASNYDALQLQYRRRFGQALQAQVSYAWAHSLDNDSSDSYLVWAGPGAGAATDRASSDFDLRHSFTAALSYEFPQRTSPGRFQHMLGGWGIETLFRAHSGFPITALDSEQYMGIPLSNAFRPDLVPGQPVWIASASAPGGRYLNPAAFAAAADGVQGSLGRNAITGFGMWQVDAAVRREFRLGDRMRLQLRIAAFNALNHANFADPVKYLDSSLFGQPTSILNMMLGTGSPGSGLSPILQDGGARMWQAGLKFQF
jgi:hypothetical protein